MNLENFTPISLREGSCVTASPNAPEIVHASRILIADDDNCIRQVISSVLAGDGFEVNTATDGEQAWDALHREHFDLLMTDNEMPRLTGLKLIERIRKEGMNLPVIVASGFIAAERMRDNPLLDIAAVLPKPFEMLDLLDTVKRALQAASATTANSGNPGQFLSNPQSAPQHN